MPSTDRVRSPISPALAAIAPPPAPPLKWKDVFARLSVVGSRPSDGTRPPLEIRSDLANLPAPVVQRALDTLENAYDLDRRFLNLPASNQPVVLGLASAQLADGRGGFNTLGINNMVGPVARFTKPGLLDGWGGYALAHEVTHLLMNRAGATISPSLIPVYFGEGVATSVGGRFLAREPTTDKAALAAFAKQIAAATSQDAAAMFASFDVPRDYQKLTVQQVGTYEHLGSFFVEFLRTQVAGTSNFFPRVGQLSKRVGQGQSFPEAFEQVFGLTLEDAQQRFVDFMAQTENDPTRRLAGTLYQGRGS